MPSVGMRRTTRVFGVVKGVDGARVLRSGRRLWPESDEGKLKRCNDWYHPGGLKCKPNGNGLTQVVANPNANVQVSSNSKKVQVEEDKMFGLVYTRKRKRNVKKYGIHYVRRHKRNKTVIDTSQRLVRFRPPFALLSRTTGFASFLSLLFNYMTRERVNLPALASFLLSQPITGVFSLHGIRFLWDPPTDTTGICKVFGARRLIPLFTVDFKAIPFCFIHIHHSIFLRFKCPPYLYVNNSVSWDPTNHCQPCNPSADDLDLVNKGALHPSLRASKLAQYRNARFQKRRSSFRRRRARNPSLIATPKPDGALLSDLITSRTNGIPFSSVVPKDKLKSSLRSTSARSLKGVSFNTHTLMLHSHTSCCFATTLVIQSDRCYREEGACVMLEMSASREWLLVVKKDGITRYTHKPQNVMRPCASNRFTHAIIWTGDDNWKLEFTNRPDWYHFKDLYKECSDRNVHLSVAKVIPVPGVWQVSGYEDDNTVPFYRPGLYISIHDDEVSRALAKRSAIYDMDSEDEEWLNKFNNDFLAQNELHEHVSEDNFELMVDAFEKAFYSSPDDYSNEIAAVSLCLDLGSKEVVQTVYSYWMKKRKQKRSALLRVFQGRQVKKPPLVPKPALRKRRSFKRLGSQCGRGKQPILLQAMAAEQDALEEQNVMMRKAEEAKLIAYRSVESAVEKRQRAQVLMEIADLAMYKAIMAVRIAEAAQVVESPDAAAHFLD